MQQQDITLVPQAADDMTTQLPYRAIGAAPHTEEHIDCGLYVILMATLSTREIPLYLITPSLVHSLRPHLALHILQGTTNELLLGWIRPSAHTVLIRDNYLRPTRPQNETSLLYTRITTLQRLMT